MGGAWQLHAAGSTMMQHMLPLHMLLMRFKPLYWPLMPLLQVADFGLSRLVDMHTTATASAGRSSSHSTFGRMNPRWLMSCERVHAVNVVERHVTGWLAWLM